MEGVVHESGVSFVLILDDGVYLQRMDLIWNTHLPRNWLPRDLSATSMKCRAALSTTYLFMTFLTRLSATLSLTIIVIFILGIPFL